MNKADFIEKIAQVTKLTKADAERTYQALVTTITEALQNGEQVVLSGFGTFEAKERAARVGHNPQTGQAIQIAAKVAPVFKASKALKDALSKIKKS